LRLYPDIEAALDAWIAQQPEPRPSRPEAIRRILRTALDISDGEPSSAQSSD
jgi:thiamine monophosphate kinase